MTKVLSLPTAILPILIFFTSLLSGVLFNPGWFGDGIWYAHDIQTGSLDADFGHLLWRPLALIVSEVISSGFLLISERTQFSFCALSRPCQLLGIDESIPLVSLQLLSLIFSAGVAVLLYLCTKLLAKSVSPAIFVSTLYSVTHFHLVYAMSGSSYSASIFFLVLSLYFTLRGRTYLSSLSIALSGSMWALALLATPGIAIMAVHLSDSDSKYRTVLKMSFLSILFFSCITLCLFYLYNSADIRLLDWLSSSGHGIAPQISLMNAARAIAGIHAFTVFTGEIQTAIKLLLLGEDVRAFEELIQTYSLFYFSTGLLFVALVLCSIFATFKISKTTETKKKYLALFLMCATALAGNFCFAVFWQGSDIERFSPGMPFLILYVGIVSIPFGNLRSLFLVSVISANLYALGLLPIRDQTRDNLWLTTELQSRTSPGDLLIITGQDLGAKVWAPAMYFLDLDVFHLLHQHNVDRHAKVSQLLLERIETSLSNGNQIIVQDALLDATALRSTSMILDSFRISPLQSSKEYPLLDIEAVQNSITKLITDCLSQSQCEIKKYQIANYQFVTIQKRGETDIKAEYPT